jgi:hypothetical protein
MAYHASHTAMYAVIHSGVHPATPLAGQPGKVRGERFPAAGGVTAAARSVARAVVLTAA